MADTNDGKPILEMKGVSKRYASTGSAEGER